MSSHASQESLELRDSILFGTREQAGASMASTAIFFVEVAKGIGPTAVYKLTVMDERDFAAWELEQQAGLDEDTTSDEIETTHSPLLVKADDLAATGLVAFIQERYLNATHPQAIDEIRDHLEGPIVSD